MTKATETTSEAARFAATRLPWIVAAAALAIYILTLNNWLALSSLSQPPLSSNSLADVSRISGWVWQPTVMEPVWWLVTYPFHWLPQAKIPLAMNLLAAVCACLTLALLARSVALLPHDRTEDQRQRERHHSAVLHLRTSWMPPALAALVCGLQLSFWENATVASGEMLNVLLFAYVVRCLLEYRMDEKPTWLYRAGLVFALGMTNNWGMIGYLPLFIASVVWLRGLSFFQLRFLLRFALWMFAGLLLYLLLPIVAAVSANVEVSVWQALKYNIGTQKGLLASITFNKHVLFLSDQPLWVLGLTSLLPMVLIGIRWPSYFGDHSRLGVALATLVFHFFHALLFAICLWVMLDPQFSPRSMFAGAPLLSLYYLCALAVGYLAGYFLLVFGVTPSSRSHAGLPPMPIVEKTVLAIVWAAAILAPAALVYRNLPYIQATNGQIFAGKSSPARAYAEASAVTLPKEGCVVLSDDARRLNMVRSVVAERGAADKYLFLETQSLQWPDYHAYIQKTQPQRFKNLVPEGAKGQIDDSSLIQLLFYLSQSNAVYYLHPSFGYYFEAFWMEPRGLTYLLHPHSTNSLLAPPLAKTAITYNEEFWKRADEHAVGQVLRLKNAQLPSRGPNLPEQLLLTAHLKKLKSPDLAVIGGFYSRARNTWAVETQKAGDWTSGHAHLRRALDLNGENMVASINLDYNAHHQSGNEELKPFSENVQDLFGRYRTWDQLMNENGPFDEPRFCFEQGRVYVRGNLYRQAGEQFNRTSELAQNHLQARLWLSQVYVLTRFPNKALEIVREIRSNATRFMLSSTNALEIMTIEAAAYLVKGDTGEAANVVNTALRQNPTDEELLGTAVQLYMNHGQLTNALELIDRQLQKQPDSPAVLVNKGFTLLQMQKYAEAVSALTKALDVETNPESELRHSALFNRAIAYLQSDKLDEAQHDYEALQKSFPTAFKLYYGLGEIAYRKTDTNAAVQQYQLYMANAPTNTTEAEFVRNRLKELSQGRP